MFNHAFQNFPHILLWALIATIAMTTILQVSQSMGLSRLSLSFLMGTLVTGQRDWANIIGFILYVIGGWIFALPYVLVFYSVQTATWWLGAILGVLHGFFLLAVILPLFPYIHPRMATEYDGPSPRRHLEPPGFLALNYGERTPLVTLFAQMVYGAILGVSYQLAG